MNDIVPIPYVETVLREQDDYRAAPPSVIPRAVRSVTKPLGGIANRLIPGELIEAAIRGADWAAHGSIRTAAISHDFTDLEACDLAAAEVRRWALGFAAAGGGAAGAFGAFGLAIDIPATVALALRTVRATGLSYGFGADTEAERVHILDVLQLAGANSREERAEAIRRLAKEREAMGEADWRKIATLTGQTTGSVAATQRVAATLGREPVDPEARPACARDRRGGGGGRQRRFPERCRGGGAVRLSRALAGSERTDRRGRGAGALTPTRQGARKR